MISAVSNNSLIAAMFGGAVAQPLRSAGGTTTNGPVQGAGPTGDYPEPVDTVEISQAGQRAAATGKPQAAQGSRPAAASKGLGGETQLTDGEQKQVRELKQRDAEVRRHESAHKASAGSNATGGPTFEFKTGPDGKRYAVGGEVKIDTAVVEGDPQATIQKMQQVRRAALAPASPSGQDRAVAAQAAATERSARAELADERRASASGTGDQQTGQTATTGATTATDSSSGSLQRSGSASRQTIATQKKQGIEQIGKTLDLVA